MASDFKKTASHGDTVKASGEPPWDSGVEFDDGTDIIYPITDIIDQNYAIQVNLQIGSRQDLKLRSFVCLFHHLFKSPFMSELRTKQQIGYYVCLNVDMHSLGVYISFSIQSPHTDPREMDRLIDAFIANSVEYVKSMSDSDFNRHREERSKANLSKPLNLSEELRYHRIAIQARTYNFTTATQLIPLINSITKDDFMTFLKLYIVPGAIKRRKASVHVWPSGKSITYIDLEQEKTIKHMNEYRSRAKYFKLMVPELEVEIPTSTNIVFRGVNSSTSNH